MEVHSRLCNFFIPPDVINSLQKGYFTKYEEGNIHLLTACNFTNISKINSHCVFIYNFLKLLWETEGKTKANVNSNVRFIKKIQFLLFHGRPIFQFLYPVSIAFVASFLSLIPPPCFCSWQALMRLFPESKSSSHAS